MNPYEQLLKSISALGPQAKCALYEFYTVEEGQRAANLVVDDDPILVTLARAGKAKIGTVKLSDCFLLVLG